MLSKMFLAYLYTVEYKTKLNWVPVEILLLKI